MQSLPVEWLPASIAPSNGDLEICVLGCDGIVRAFVVWMHPKIWRDLPGFGQPDHVHGRRIFTFSA